MDKIWLIFINLQGRNIMKYVQKIYGVDWIKN